MIVEPAKKTEETEENVERRTLNVELGFVTGCAPALKSRKLG
jgi:hypothetical protein